MRTEKQIRALAKLKKRLEQAFQSAQGELKKPGNGRNWFVPYLVEVVASYYSARKRTIDGVKLCKLVGPKATSSITRVEMAS
jgi:hypothetical protein